MRMKKKGERLQIVNFKADPELIDWIRNYASEHDTYTSEVIRYALYKLKEECQKPKAGKES